MQDEFIEGLRRKAKEGEEAYKETIMKEYPWLSDDELEEKVFEDTLKKTFNTRGGEER